MIFCFRIELFFGKLSETGSSRCMSGYINSTKLSGFSDKLQKHLDAEFRI